MEVSKSYNDIFYNAILGVNHSDTFIQMIIYNNWSNKPLAIYNIMSFTIATMLGRIVLTDPATIRLKTLDIYPSTLEDDRRWLYYPCSTTCPVTHDPTPFNSGWVSAGRDFAHQAKDLSFLHLLYSSFGTRSPGNDAEPRKNIGIPCHKIVACCSTGQ